MEKDNSLLIIEESDNDTKAQEENSAGKLKLALATKKLKEEFFKENEINKTTKIINDDFENEIDQSLLEMEQTAGLAYETESDDDGRAASSNGNFSKRRTTSSSTSDSDDDDNTISAKNSKLIESSVLQRKLYDEYQQIPSMMFQFYGRRRLSECKEESESDDEVEAPLTKPVIVITNGSEVKAPKQRFTVTKATEEQTVETSFKQPVSILKKDSVAAIESKESSHSFAEEDSLRGFGFEGCVAAEKLANDPLSLLIERCREGQCEIFLFTSGIPSAPFRSSLLRYIAR